jgi:hypothetical protein
LDGIQVARVWCAACASECRRRAAARLISHG